MKNYPNKKPKQQPKVENASTNKAMPVSAAENKERLGCWFYRLGMGYFGFQIIDKLIAHFNIPIDFDLTPILNSNWIYYIFQMFTIVLMLFRKK